MLSLTLVTVMLVGGAGPEHVSFPTQDGGVVHADLYGKGDHGVVLAHGGRFNKESWATQARQVILEGSAHAQQFSGSFPEMNRIRGRS
jgi:hypothetical protein